uniref:TF-B3 domain-containing protein n=1 Tax=Chenopodium quinoa TaxID=63459 RepID=A0A803LZW1_CHEQI
MEGSDGQQGGIQKTERLFCKELTESDVLHLSVPKGHQHVFIQAQDEKGEVGIIELQSGEEWRFHLRFFSESCIFHNGWHQFVKAKELAAGHSVIFHRTVGLKSEKLQNQLYIECIDPSQKPSIIRRPESSSIVSLGQKNTRNIQPFNDMLQSLRALEEKEHLVVNGKSRHLQLHVGFSRSRYSRLTRYSPLDSLISSPQVSAQCVDCFLLLSIFPKEYEIDRDTLVQLWMVAGHLQEVSANYISAGYLEAIQSSGGTLSVQGKTSELGWCGTRVLKRLAGTRTLWFLRGHESCIEHVPYDFFISLRVLEVLSLNGTKLSELPSSIAILKDLRYLDLSETLIKHLPETIGRLRKLQTLKLQNCPHLVTLPKTTTKLESLVHLDLGTLCYLNSICPRIGALTRLRTLSEFPVGTESECSLAELKNLKYLQGSFCLSRLQNVSNLEEVKEANLRAKPSLLRLELRWCPRAEKDIKIDDQVIEYLEPQAMLTNLRVLYYGGSKFPSWIANPSFKNLMSITLSKCEQCQYLPALGQLCSLESITLNGLLGVRIIDLNFCGNSASTIAGSADGAFPNLQNLTLTSMLNLESWRDMGELCFPSLRKLTIKDCPKLADLCSLTNILSLQVLEMSYCPLLSSLPRGRLPASVEQLVIEDCPLLKSSCSKLHGQDWHKMEHIPSVWIDYEEISSH